MKKIPPTSPVSWQDFGQFLFACREADPGYYIIDYLRRLGYGQDQLFRFTVGWVTFYNLGIAARASELEGKKFYAMLRDVYPTATRGSERRHFRGEAGMRAIDYWQAKWPNPEAMVKFIFKDALTNDPLTMGHIRTRCDSVLQLGPYFHWKFGDLAEVLLRIPVQFRGWEQQSPKVPQQGAALIAAEAGNPGMTTTGVYRSIVKQMADLEVSSPYAKDLRPFDVQDAETICCVYKQYRSGGYVPGLRTAKAAARLQVDGANCRTAKTAYAALLENQPRREFQDPAKLARILAGEQRYSVYHFL